MRRASAEPAAWVVNRSTVGRISLPRLSELLRLRELAIVLAMRDLQVRYKQTFFGVAWAVLQPLAATGAFTLVFSAVAGLKSGTIPYAVFALAGVVGWSYFNAAVMRCSTALVLNEAMVTKVYFPRLLLCIGAVLPSLVDFAVGLSVLATLMVITGTPPGLGLVALPLLIVALALFTLGTGCLLAAVNVTYRDVQHALPFLLQIGFFVTPVAYSSALASNEVGWAYYLNPMAGLIDALRWSLVDAPPPPLQALLSLAVGAVLVAAGLLLFGRTERRFADVI